MKKIILSNLICVISIASFAQNVGIGTNAPTAKLHVVGSGGVAFYAFNNGASGYGIVGKSDSTSAFGVRGLSDKGVGVYGESVTGSGVKGYGNNAGSVAVFGSALAGTGVRAFSFTGKALEVLGNLSISGGNTNPSSGAVLTSDAAGNAVWKNNKIGFAASSSDDQDVNNETTTIVVFDENTWNYGNGFKTNSAATNKNTFIAPVSGFYHFDADCLVILHSITTNLENASISMDVNGNTVDWRSGAAPIISAADSRIPLIVNNNMHLYAGDKVTISVLSKNFTSQATEAGPSHFSGYLIFAD